MQQENFTTRVMRADNGFYHTQKAEVDIMDRILADVVALGKNDSPENWHEISREEAEAYRAEKEEILRKREEEERKQMEEAMRMQKVAPDTANE